MQYEIIATVRLVIIAEIYGLPDAELCAHSNLQNNPQETVDHEPAAGCSSQSCGSAPRRGQTGAVRYLIWCQAVPRTFATVLPPLMLPLPIQIPHTKNWRSRGDARITNRWPGGSLRPPDTRRASGGQGRRRGRGTSRRGQLQINEDEHDKMGEKEGLKSPRCHAKRDSRCSAPVYTCPPASRRVQGEWRPAAPSTRHRRPPSSPS